MACFQVVTSQAETPAIIRFLSATAFVHRVLMGCQAIFTMVVIVVRTAYLTLTVPKAIIACIRAAVAHYVSPPAQRNVPGVYHRLEIAYCRHCAAKRHR